MTKTLRSLAFMVIAIGTILFVTRASAESSLSIRIGPQAPPHHEDYRRWESPHRTAVWIPGHNEWRQAPGQRHGRYVWVGGYYAYPSHKGSQWVAPRYSRDRDGNYNYRAPYWTK